MGTDDFVCGLTVRPVWWNRAPHITVTLDDQVRWSGPIETELMLDWCQPLPRGQHRIDVQFSGKTNTDSTPEQDHAVVIEQLEFFGIRDDRFRWQGVYQPEYPEPWRSEQVSWGIQLPHYLSPHTYLGWNGTWRLEFSTPIFTWMHGVLGMGWIYP